MLPQAGLGPLAEVKAAIDSSVRAAVRGVMGELHGISPPMQTPSPGILPSLLLLH